MAIEGKIPNVWVRCDECGGGYRNHCVLFEEKHSIDDGDGGWDHDEYHQLIKCMGCETIRYRRYSLSQVYDTDMGPPVPYAERFFPSNDTEPGKRAVSTFGGDEEHIPKTVFKMYNETVVCLNARARTLAGGGLRATVEAICLEQGIEKGTLVQKIDELASKGLLTKAQAQFLHEERYIGNAALHELESPTKDEIELGLGIVEGLLTTLYVLPAKADQLKKTRESKAKKKPPRMKK